MLGSFGWPVDGWNEFESERAMLANGIVLRIEEWEVVIALDGWIDGGGEIRFFAQSDSQG